MSQEAIPTSLRDPAARHTLEWKLGTELLYVPAQAYGAWWEVLERGSSYAAPLLWIGLQQVLTAHSVPAQGLIPRRWLHPQGRAASHAAGHIPS